MAVESRLKTHSSFFVTDLQIESPNGLTLSTEQRFTGPRNIWNSLNANSDRGNKVQFTIKCSILNSNGWLIV